MARCVSPNEIRFAVDGMLQSLGDWLRLLGYDCVSGHGRQFLEQAVADRRVFLTRNFHLPDNLPQTLLRAEVIVYVRGENLPAQLREVVGEFALDTERFVFTRCVACNVPLQKTEPTTDVPARVLAREREFWRCERCGKTFWRGSHVTNSLERLRRWLQTSSDADQPHLD
jgi:uncharacterized protein with PIN domain